MQETQIKPTIQVFKIGTIKELKVLVNHLSAEYDDCSIVLKDSYGHEAKINNAVLKDNTLILNDDLGFEI